MEQEHKNLTCFSSNIKIQFPLPFWKWDYFTSEMLVDRHKEKAGLKDDISDAFS